MWTFIDTLLLVFNVTASESSSENKNNCELDNFFSSLWKKIMNFLFFNSCFLIKQLFLLMKTSFPYIFFKVQKKQLPFKTYSVTSDRFFANVHEYRPESADVRFLIMRTDTMVVTLVSVIMKTPPLRE